MRKRDEETIDQREAVQDATRALVEALEDMVAEGKSTAKALSRKGTVKSTPRADLSEFHALYRKVVRAEESLDMAVYDLNTASGEDG